jgi:adenylate cyclase
MIDQTTSNPTRRDAARARQALVDKAERILLGPRAEGMLSLAAQRALAADQRSSELLVCGMQFLAILLFALVYALAPKAFPTSVPFEPVPWALAVYTLFTAIRLWLTLTDRLTPMFLATSVIVDIVLLMLTIWSFHLQYQQPATIYLKSPTLF